MLFLKVMLPLSNDYAITYGAGVSLPKEECINHIGKRLGTALRNVVSEGDASTFKRLCDNNIWCWGLLI